MKDKVTCRMGVNMDNEKTQKHEQVNEPISDGASENKSREYSESSESSESVHEDVSQQEQAAAEHSNSEAEHTEIENHDAERDGAEHEQQAQERDEALPQLHVEAPDIALLDTTLLQGVTFHSQQSFDSEQDNQDKISITSVKKYLRAFKEFMLFCKQRHYIPESLNDDVLIPKRKESVKVDGFTNDELKLIFNPSFYPKKDNIYHPCRYWIPLIALYSGMRLNEICQLYVDDIKYNNIWYFSLTDERELQHLKNEQSKRDIPVHPKLIELGFINYVKEVRKCKKERLFYTLQYSKKNHFSNAVSGWFARYLKSLNIEGRNKVFHSFRHLVKPMLRDAGIAQEYQNAICGWSSNDIGERVYGGKVPIKKLYEEICKLQYPFLDKNLEEIKKLNEK